MFPNNLPDQHKLRNFFRQASLLRYGKRELILHASDTPSGVFFIKEGYIRVYRLSEGGEELTLTILQPGDLFPLTFGLHKSNNQYFLESMTPLALWKAPQESFLTFIKQDSEMFYQLVGESFVRFEGFLSRMEYFIFNTAYVKVAAALLTCAKTLGRRANSSAAVTIPVPLTHRDIATMIGITRETTSLEMKKLENQGFIRKSRRQITIVDEEVLERSLFAGNIELAPQQQLLNS